MSDSEDSFESADEGEQNSTSHSKTQKTEQIDKTQESEEKSVPAKKTTELETKQTVEEKPVIIDEKYEVDANKTVTPPGDCKANEVTPTGDCTTEEAEEKGNTTEESKPASGEGEKQEVISKSETNSTKTSVDNKTARSALDKLAAEENKSGWGWSGWGSSFLQTASSSVSTFTSSVGEGFSNVLETVESSLGGPDSKEISDKDTEEKVQDSKSPEKCDESEVNNSKRSDVDPDVGPGNQSMTREAGDTVDPQVVVDDTEKDSGWFSTLGMTALTGAVKNTVQQTSSLVQEKSKGLVHGGLDVLETLGKKTFDVLAEGDHGLKKTLEKAKEKPNLSQLLREAAGEAEEMAKREEEFVESRKSHFGAQFEEFQGLVQLEALEMLSNQCESKLHTLLGAMDTDQLTPIKPELVAVRESFELGDLDDEDVEEHDFGELVTEYTGQLALNITADRLIQVHNKYSDWLKDCLTKADEDSGAEGGISSTMIHQVAIQSLAELTARIIGHFHRCGQLMLIKPQGPVTAYKDKATAMASLTRCVCSEVSIVSTKFTERLVKSAEGGEDPDSMNSLITNIYLEAGNSSSYIQDAFQLLLPTIQQAAVEASSS